MQTALLNRLRILLRYLSNRRALAVLIFGVVGFTFPMLYGFAFGLPVPTVHDEHSYLLAADTVAEGRWTNPTPLFAEHFESPHILVKPSYIAKYPPMQALFLGAGQILFGNPVFGVWLSCGAAMAALFWMLTGWTKFRWAILGTLLMLFLVGIDSYWAQSYWGGMAAATGGALFFGGFRRLFEKLSYKTTLLMVLGSVILVNSRPFEGSVMMLPALAVLLFRLLRGGDNSAKQKLLQVVLPGLLLTGIALSFMLYYNFKVTGSVLKLPYSEHTRQYYPNPLFIFQSKDESSIGGHDRLREFNEQFKVPPLLENVNEFLNLPDAVYLRFICAFFLLIIIVPYFLLSPPLTILLYASVPAIIKKDKWTAFIFLTVLFTFFCMSLAVWWDSYHYSAPLTCCFCLLLTESLRQFVISGKADKSNLKNSIVCVSLAGLIAASIIYSQIYPAQQIFIANNSVLPNAKLKESLADGKYFRLTIPERATYVKSEIEKAVKQLPDKYLAIVSYDKNYTFHDEIVYNRANLEAAEIIWAHSLSVEKDARLINYYADRKVLLIKISDSQFEINPLPAN